MTTSPRVALAAGSVATIAFVNLTGIAFGPAHLHTMLLICALLAVGAAAQSAALDRGDLTPALLLSLPPVISLISKESSTWPVPFLAAMLLVAGELNALSWDCDGVGPVGGVLRQRLRHILQLGVLGLTASLIVIVASAAPAPGGIVPVLIGAAALAALGTALFTKRRADLRSRSDTV